MRVKTSSEQRNLFDILAHAEGVPGCKSGVDRLAVINRKRQCLPTPFLQCPTIEAHLAESAQESRSSDAKTFSGREGSHRQRRSSASKQKDGAFRQIPSGGLRQLAPRSDSQPVFPSQTIRHVFESEEQRSLGHLRPAGVNTSLGIRSSPLRYV